MGTKERKKAELLELLGNFFDGDFGEKVLQAYLEESNVPEPLASKIVSHALNIRDFLDQPGRNTPIVKVFSE